jgi:hypothetical protein
MPRAGFEPTIPVFERSKSVRASDRAAIGTGVVVVVVIIIIIITRSILPPCRAVSVNWPSSSLTSAILRKLGPLTAVGQSLLLKWGGGGESRPGMKPQLCHSWPYGTAGHENRPKLLRLGRVETCNIRRWNWKLRTGLSCSCFEVTSGTFRHLLSSCRWYGNCHAVFSKFVFVYRKKRIDPLLSAVVFHLSSSRGISVWLKINISFNFFTCFVSFCAYFNWTPNYTGVYPKSFRTGRLELELQMIQLSSTRCSCIAVLWVSVVSFAAITLCVPSQWVFIVVSVYFVIDSVRKILDTLWITDVRQQPSH